MMPLDPIQSEGEAALKRIASACRSSIDDVLDIMSKLPERSQPGACMLCFFSLYRKLPPHCEADLDRVKAWLEREIEVVATDDASNVLEDFCHRVMEERKGLFRPGMSKLMLAFRFCPMREERTA